MANVERAVVGAGYLLVPVDQAFVASAENLLHQAGLVAHWHLIGAELASNDVAEVDGEGVEDTHCYTVGSLILLAMELDVGPKILLPQLADGVMERVEPQRVLLAARCKLCIEGSVPVEWPTGR